MNIFHLLDVQQGLLNKQQGNKGVSIKNVWWTGPKGRESGANAEAWENFAC